MRYLRPDEILEIHSILIDETGGAHGVRDRVAIMHAVEQPKQGSSGGAFYETVFEKAAVYARTIIQGHPFVDGNKRTAVTAAGVFLELNGYALSVPQGEIEAFAYHIVNEKPEISDMVVWLKGYAEKTK